MRHTLRRTTAKTTRTRRARGGAKGKTAGRGHKGQRSRSGDALRPQLRDIIKKIPKKRGHNSNRSRTIKIRNIPVVSVNLKDIKDVLVVTPRVLKNKNIIRHSKGKQCFVKILGVGEVTNKHVVRDCLLTKTARKKIKEAGGDIIA